MANITIAASVLPGTTDTPLDARCRVTNEAEILNIENPCVGLLVFCTGSGKFYVVTKLKSKQIGVFLVENASVDTYIELIPANQPSAAREIELSGSAAELLGAENVEAALIGLNTKKAAMAQLESLRTDVSKKIPTDRIGASGGVASLNEYGEVPADQLPTAEKIKLSDSAAASLGKENVETALKELNTRKAESAQLESLRTDVSKKIPTDRIGIPGGIASLNEDGIVPAAQLPAAISGLTPPSTITLPIPTDIDNDNISLVIDFSVDGTFVNQSDGVPENYCRVTMIDHYSKMRIFRHEAWEELNSKFVELPDYGSSVEFTIDQEMFPGYEPGKKYFARYKWIDSDYAGDDWIGFSFRGDVVDVRPIRLTDELPPRVNDHGALAGVLTFDFSNGDIQNFSLSDNATLDIADVYNVVFGQALILNCTPGDYTLTVSNGEDRQMICSGDKMFVIVITNFGSLQIAISETV